MEMIEVTANSVDAAISKGLAELNATPGDVMIEVLEEPNTGLFGFGAREARVRIVLIGRRKGEEREESVEEARGEPDTQESFPLPEVSDDELDEIIYKEWIRSHDDKISRLQSEMILVQKQLHKLQSELEQCTKN